MNHMRRKLLKVKTIGVLAVILVLFMTGGIANGEKEALHDKSGKWNYDVEDGCATIGWWTDIKEPTGKLTIPKKVDQYTVRGIRTSAFVDCDRLTSITIPEGVTSIGDFAFYCCYGLKSVTIPASVTSIGKGAFLECRSVKITVSPKNERYKVVDGVLFDKQQNILMYCPGNRKGAYEIPEGTLLIDDYAFWSGCLTSVTIPDGVTGIGNEAFAVCEDLISIRIPESVNRIGTQAFTSCKALISIRIPEGVTRIPARAFSNCSSLTSVVIPGSVTSIGNRAFYECSSLTEVTIPNGVKSIRPSAFAKCRGLTSVVIPGSCSSIDAEAFSECSGLTEVTIPNGVKSIGGFAFAGLKGLTNVAIPDSVTYIAQYPFAGCVLASIDVAPSNPAYEQIDGVLFDKQRKMLVAYPSAREGEYAIPSGTLLIGDGAFAWCGNLTAVTIPDSVTYIGDGAFGNCSSLTSVIVPNSVTHIGRAAFSGCKNLTSATIPAGLIKRAEEVSFGKDVSLVVATGERIDDTGKWRYAPTGDGAMLISYAGELPSGDLLIPGEVDGYTITGIGGDAFRQNLLGPTTLTSVTIPDSVKYIGDSAFFGCSEMTGVALPDNLVTIGDNAFSECTKLTDLILPDTVKSVGRDSFDSQNLILRVSPGNPVYAVVDGALIDKLQNTLITCTRTIRGEYAIPDGTFRIEDHAFDRCYDLKGVTIPASVVHIGDAAFSRCGLTDVIIPDGVISLGDSVFNGCSFLTRCSIPASVTDIGADNFRREGLILSVVKGSFAEEYAEENNVLYVLAEE